MIGAGVAHDGGMVSHAVSMHYALSKGKRLLHSPLRYANRMETENERLKAARIAAGFPTAADAARGLGMPVGTYSGHENGHRGFPKSRAPFYARKFKTTEEWLLYGKGDQVAKDPFPSAELMSELVREVIDQEVPVGTPLGDFPRIVGPGLRDRLEKFATDPTVADFWAEKLARDKVSRSPAPTKRDAGEGSRSA